MYYYSDGTTLYVVDEDYAPDYILPDGSRVYSVPGDIEEDREPDWIELDGSRVYDLRDTDEDFDPRDIADEDFEPDYVTADGSRVYDLDNYEFEPDYVMINGMRVCSDGSIR